jgi:hypothetical protein
MTWVELIDAFDAVHRRLADLPMDDPEALEAALAERAELVRLLAARAQQRDGSADPIDADLLERLRQAIERGSAPLLRLALGRELLLHNLARLENTRYQALAVSGPPVSGPERSLDLHG